MRPGTSRWIALAAALLLALATLWYFASPSWTLHRMQAAAKAGDGDALVAMIDFPALRTDVKAELMARMAKAAERDKSGAAGLGVALGGVFLAPMVDAMVSPEGVRAALIDRPGAEGGDGAEAGRDGGERNARRLPGLKIPEKPVIVRRGLSEFLLASETDRASGLVFRRDGLSWKLAGIALPADVEGPAI